MLVPLGHSGLRVSRICLGTMTFGHPDYGCDAGECRRILDSYLDAGHNFIDSADIYARGAAEDILGRALGARRKHVVLATKGFWAVERGPNLCGATRKHLLEACDASLKRLQTDYIDLYYVHVWDPVTPLEETLAALHTLVEQGKVRYLGVSDYSGWQLAEAMNLMKQNHWHKFVVHQVEYSCLVRDIENDVAPASRYYNLGLVTWSPLAAGLLTGKYGDGTTMTSGRFVSGDAGRWWGQRFLSPENFRAAIEFVKIAAELNISPVTLAVAYAMRIPGHTSTSIGCRHHDQLEANLAAENFVIPPEAIEKINALRPPPKLFPYSLHQNAKKLRNLQDYSDKK